MHHVTAIAGDPQRNLAFFTGVLGMRLVKRSVNQDDPHTYHLFYADGDGNPGTDLTFFPWPGRPRGSTGPGMAAEVGLAVAEESLPFWTQRLGEAGVDNVEEDRFGERAVVFSGPDGLHLALYGITEPANGRVSSPWSDGPVPGEHQIRGLHVARLLVSDLQRSSRFLTDTFGYESAGEEDGWRRFSIDGGGSGRILDVRGPADEKPGTWGPGTVHHVAFRATDDGEQLAVRDAVEAAGRGPTPVINRFWFHSVYFREPGGVLFEVATDGPGFAVDEHPDELGGRLILPPWLESRRVEIEAALPPLDIAVPPA